MAKKSIATASVCVMLVLTLLLSGCDDRQDTREYINTIGAVVTMDVDNVFQELYVYPGTIQDMGQDFIKNTRQITRVGSFGVTVEEADSYHFWLKDRDGGAYAFEKVPLENGDLAVITFDGELLLTVHHQGGGTDEVVGAYVPPDDAPSQSQVDLKKQDTFKFNLHNGTGQTITKVTMREAAEPDIGEVELYLKPLQDGDKVAISDKLDDSDFEITEWLLYVESDTGESWLSEADFDPWSVKDLYLSLQDGALALRAE